ncbi:WxL domain-containing protein, partial [Enterococcus casseliflavus]|uniref:WxL domain-containing protein n=1 Tax=Enterococcus casseliflavus TaxID=37734 RepID=UPI0039A51658
MTLCKKITRCGIIFFFLLVFPNAFIQVYAETDDKIDDETVAHFKAHQPEYLSLSTSISNPDSIALEQPSEPVQAFSFVHKSFRSTVGQFFFVRFTSKLTTDQVLIRIPLSGQVSLAHFSNGESVSHSHGEYWFLQTQQKQTEFELPVFFEETGNYFITIGHDADFFYLEIEEDITSIVETSADNVNSDEINDVEQSAPIIETTEHDLVISEELLILEDERVLEETRDSQDRSTSNVGNWAQFQSAWNSSSTIAINLIEVIEADSSLALNVRDQSIKIFLNFNIYLQQRATLTVSGAANLEVDGSYRGTGIYNQSGSHTPSIYQSGSGRVLLKNRAILERGSIIVQNISIQEGSGVSFMDVFEIISAPSGSLEIVSTPINFTTGISRTPIRMGGNVTANIRGVGALIHQNQWNSVDLQLDGPQAGNVISAITEPNDFALLYANSDLASNYATDILLNTFESPAPRPSFSLSLQASPVQGGNPVFQGGTIQQGSSTIITANPRSGYNFVNWEIVSGTGSSIESVTSETTTFTMGNQNAVVRAIYEESRSAEVHVYHTDRLGHDLIEPEILTGSIGEDYQTEPASLPNYQLVETPDNATGTFTNETISVVYVYDIESVSPVDPLDPDAEVDPENKPELPEDQGLLSIDFVSNFNFGSQAISAHDQTYYAQPQRLLNEDQTVNEDEERPNYIQVS